MGNNWPPRARRYFSRRTSKDPAISSLDLEALKKLFKALFENFEADGYFQEAFGYYCVDAEDVQGLVGDEERFFLQHLRKMKLWPIEERVAEYSEEDLFDVIELLFDVVAKPTKGYYHSYGSCGSHYSEFSRTEGQAKYREEINELLADYQDGWELNAQGELISLGWPGLSALFKATLVRLDPKNVEGRVESAINQYRSRGATFEERRQAVRELADILEYLRPNLKQVLTSKDEADLFNIANNFAIRHHNELQKGDYDPTWLSWMFYYYLATIHLATRRIRKRQDAKT